VKLAFATATERCDRPGEILTSINNALTGKFERAYVTACVVVIDPRADSMAYAAAGHPPPVVRRDQGRIERLEQGGVALALLPVATYATANAVLSAGDRLVLYTDGLLEGMRPGSDEFFGDTELARVVADAPPSANLSERVLEAYRAWTGGGAPTDDVTLVVVERLLIAQ
jgi:serine phosphatase RsbU (regulator of sigma subunit)